MFNWISNWISGSEALIDISTVDLSLITSEVTRLIPIVLPVIVAFIALRKGIAFLQNSLRGA